MLQKQFLIIALITAPFIFSQNPNDTLVASQYYQKASTLYKKGKFEASIIFYKKSLNKYLHTKKWIGVARSYTSIAKNQISLRKFKKSFQNSIKSLEICSKYLPTASQQEAYNYENIGEYYLRTLDYSQALKYHEKSLEIRQNILPEYHKDIASSYSNIALVHQRKSNYNASLEFYKKALVIFLKTRGPNDQATASCYNNLGNIFNYLGELNKARIYYKKYLNTTIKNYGEDHINVGIGYVNIGASCRKLNLLEDALKYYQKAIPIAMKKKNQFLLPGIYNNMGIIFRIERKFNKAAEYYKKSLEMKLQIYDKKHPRVAMGYVGLGNVFTDKDDTQNALLYYNKALKIYKNLYSENHFEVANIYEYIGSLYKTNKKFTLAEEYYKKQLLICNTIFEKNSPLIAQIYSNIGNTHFQKEAFDSALSYYNKSLNILEKKYGIGHHLTIDSYLNIGKILVKQNKLKKGVSYFDKALLLNSKNKKTTDIFNPNGCYDIRVQLAILKNKANILKTQYVVNENPKYLQESIKIYKNINTLITQIRKSYENPNDKLFFSKIIKEVYAEAIESLFLNYKKSGEQQILDDIFYYSENSKANVLKELLSDTKFKKFAGLSENLLATEAKAKTDRAYYQSELIKEKTDTLVDITQIKKFENQLFKINRKQDSITNLLEKNYPNYYTLKHQSKVISIPEIQEGLNEKRTLVEFFTTDSTIYTFIISKNKMAVKNVMTTELSQQIADFREAIISQNILAYKKTARALYKTLIDPIKKELVGDELIIIPDGSLWHLNFDLLLTTEPLSDDPVKMSYLIKDYAISYANSATLLFNPFQKDEIAKKRKGCLAFSFSDSTNSIDTENISLATLRNTENNLPGTRKEIKAISKLIDGQYFLGNKANEATFKKNAGKYNILHLALHGEVDNEHPENSKLYFTKSTDTIEDDVLYSHEVFALNIPADLTVLSACNTGSGKVAKGEGIMSLGNAFQYAGTKSLLLSSWEVSDITTPQLMKYFYSNLKNGMNKAKALQKAKLQYINTAEAFYSNPFYWGSFYIIGDTSAIRFDDSFSYWISGSVLLLGIFLMLFCITYKFGKNY